MSDPLPAIEKAVRSGRLISDADLQIFWRLPPTKRLDEDDRTIATGPYLATPLRQADGRRLWRLSRGIETPANPNSPTSRIIALPLPGMRCLQGAHHQLTAPTYIKDDFAPAEILAETLARLSQREPDFVAAGTTDAGLAGLRQSRILADAAALEDDWRAWIRPEIKWAMDQFGMHERVSGLEVQMTVHGDGAFYRTHRDVSDSVETDTRIVTFVYYLSRSPRPFSGGQLKLYDYRCVEGIWRQAETFRLIEPEPNRLILFPACFLHEVLPVESLSGAFADSRFTVNGWVHR
ncbi:MAG: 2OG-Fe(II) oxygenase [Candidatus Sericytochromatia bacterium]|nr:2OG-Fe(II) oxygenase [Candidatus Sericytochromatia bacterium]